MKKILVLVLVLAALLGFFLLRKKPKTLELPTSEAAHPKAAEEASTPAALETKAPQSAESEDEPHHSECTAFYDKYVRGRTFKEGGMAFIDDLQSMNILDLIDDSCRDQISDVLDFSRMNTLGMDCINPLAKKDNKEAACLKLMAAFWFSFTENETLGMDFEELSPEQLHQKIMLRIVDFEHFKKEADLEDKTILAGLLDVMHDKRPDIDYGSVRSDLIAEIYRNDPKTFEEDYQRILAETENQNIVHAVSTYYFGHKKLDATFLEYVEGLVGRFPNRAGAHMYRAYALTYLNQWDEAGRAADRAEQLDTDKVLTKLLVDLRSSIQKKKPDIVFQSTLRWFTDLPDTTGSSTSVPGQG